MAIAIIQPFEIIKVDHHQRHSLAASEALCNQCVAGGADRAPVETTGQWIYFRQFACLRFGNAALADLIGHVAIAPPAKDDQRNIEQQRVRQQPVRGQANALKRAHHLRHDAAASSDEHDDRRKRDAKDKHILARLAHAHAVWLLTLICAQNLQNQCPPNAGICWFVGRQNKILVKQKGAKSLFFQPYFAQALLQEIVCSYRCGIAIRIIRGDALWQGDEAKIAA